MKYFEIDDFKCPCCNKNEMDKTFLERLDKARGFAATPFVISSGYRCKFHNKAVGGSSSSSHMKGLAVDIVAKASAQRYKILTGLIEAGFNRLGMGENFVHADYDEAKSPHVVWVY